jgi:hypothetical protein
MHSHAGSGHAVLVTDRCGAPGCTHGHIAYPKRVGRSRETEIISSAAHRHRVLFQLELATTRTVLFWSIDSVSHSSTNSENKMYLCAHTQYVCERASCLKNNTSPALVVQHKRERQATLQQPARVKCEQAAALHLKLCCRRTTLPTQSTPRADELP